MELVRWLVTPVVLVAVVMGLGGCPRDASDRPGPSGKSESASALASATSAPVRRTFLDPLEKRLQASVAQEARAGAQRAKVAAFLRNAKRIRDGHLGTAFGLLDV